MAVSVCSATDVAFAFGVLTTTIPFSVAALTSIVSTPTPCRPMTLSASAASMISRVKGRHPDDDSLHPFDLFDDRRYRRIGGHADIEAVVEHLHAAFVDRLDDQDLLFHGFTSLFSPVCFISLIS